VTPDGTPLDAYLRELIATEGPIGIERFMAICLADPVHGYYMTRDPLGASGDFTTAPEISQIFGELIGLWAVQCWHGLGSPPALHLVELGPGRGTLMADALRAARLVPAFRAALHVHLVETSPVLTGLQRHTLDAAGVPLAWHARLEDVPAGPAIVIANEFFDALPIRQFVSQGGRWHERMVGLAAGKLIFGLDGEPAPGMTMRARDGDVLEVGFAGLAVTEQLAGRLARDGGAALVIDYGHAATGFGDTLQAVKHHAFADPLADPGAADLTAHVDFAALLRQARTAGAAVHGPVPQATFLERLGARQRAAALQKGAADEETRAGIAAALARLTDTAPKGMGSLFKAIALTAPGQPVPAGFETQD